MNSSERRSRRARGDTGGQPGCSRGITTVPAPEGRHEHTGPASGADIEHAWRCDGEVSGAGRDGPPPARIVSTNSIATTGVPRPRRCLPRYRTRFRIRSPPVEPLGGSRHHGSSRLPRTARPAAQRKECCAAGRGSVAMCLPTRLTSRCRTPRPGMEAGALPSRFRECVPRPT